MLLIDTLLRRLEAGASLGVSLEEARARVRTAPKRELVEYVDRLRGAVRRGPPGLDDWLTLALIADGAGWAVSTEARQLETMWLAASIALQKRSIDEGRRFVARVSFPELKKVQHLLGRPAPADNRCHAFGHRLSAKYPASAPGTGSYRCRPF